MKFDPNKYGFQGDPEAPNLLGRLAVRNPDVQWVVIGKNSGFDKVEMPDNVVNAWRPDVPRGPYSYGDNGHICTFCKAESPLNSAIDCCETGRYVHAYNQYIIDLMKTLDGFVIHIGQHGNHHGNIPPSNQKWESGVRSKTYAWARNYGRYLLEGLNAAGDLSDGNVPVVWLCADPRNYLKPRDLKWPARHPILAQYEYERVSKHDRFLDPRLPESFDLPFNATTDRDGELWLAHDRYVYSGLEFSSLPDDWPTWGKRPFNDRAKAGIATTASWSIHGANTRRSWLVKNYLLDTFPDAEVMGKWDEKSKNELDGHVVYQGSTIDFAMHLSSWRVTTALPAPTAKAMDSRWVTAKPWQCFAANTACFLLSTTDEQGWVLPVRQPPVDQPIGLSRVADDLWSMRKDWTEEDLHLARWLRPLTADEFSSRAKAIAESRDVWTWITSMQRDLLQRRWSESMVESMIESMIGLHS